MNIKPIKTEADYKDALLAIEQVWEALPSSPEGDRLDILVTYVEAYEEQYHLILPYQTTHLTTK